MQSADGGQLEDTHSDALRPEASISLRGRDKTGCQDEVGGVEGCGRLKWELLCRQQSSLLVRA